MELLNLSRLSRYISSGMQTWAHHLYKLSFYTLRLSKSYDNVLEKYMVSRIRW